MTAEGIIILILFICIGMLAVVSLLMSCLMSKRADIISQRCDLIVEYQDILNLKLRQLERESARDAQEQGK